MIVMKFGGLSVENAEAMERVARIVAERLPQRPVVVLSAMGKTTDQLVRCTRLASEGNLAAASEELQKIRRHHEVEAVRCLRAFEGSAVAAQLHKYFAELQSLLEALSILKESSPRSQAAIASFGELLSTLIFASLLEQKGIPATLLDARQLVRTNSEFYRAAPDMETTRSNLQAVVPALVKAGRVPVIQGFIGSDASGVPTILGRGGSDYTAAIVGALLDSEEIQIWTHVAGILTTDPKLVPGARKIRTISFAEASELAYFGARVLHPSTILPAVEKDIPVLVLDSRNPAGSGTRIVAQPGPCRTSVKSIAYKKGVVIVNITSTRMFMAYGFLKKIFEVFERHQRSVDMVTTSEVSVSLTLDDAEKLQEITDDLSALGRVNVEKDKAIICLVGDKIKFTPGVAAQAFSAVDSINIHMVSQGASVINLSFVIDEDKVEEALGRLHERFFSDLDPDVFE
ncbi:MAG TPA: lysine-sensitive aspartokinase 3 [Acidobacteriota bacterium]|jgi:aspartate kinase